MFLGKVQTL